MAFQRLIFSFLFLFVTLTVHAQVDSVLYTFNSLTAGPLNGQGGWTTIDQTTGGTDFTVSEIAGTTPTPSGTQGVFYNASGAGFGRTAFRKDFGDFTLDLATGGFFEIEVDMHRNWWGAYIGLGYDGNNNGILAPGHPSEPNDGGFLMQTAGVNFPNSNKIQLPDGSSHIFNFNNGGWLRYKIFVDLNANNGAGQMALLYKTPPFTGDWIAVSDIQGIDMGLTPGSGDALDPATWDGVFFHSQGGLGFFDNILIRRPGAGGLSPQFIDFPEIGKRLTTSSDITLDATADSGLPVEFEVLSGPASLSGNVLTLDGTEGIVEIRATQPGDTAWAAAIPIVRSFEVIDPSLYAPDLIIRRPVDLNQVIMPVLKPMLLVASANIAHDDVLAVSSVDFNINGTSITAKDWGTGYYTAWWEPSMYGVHSMTVNAHSSEGPITMQTIHFDIVNTVQEMEVTLFEDLRAGAADTNIVLPIFVGGFDSVRIYLDYNCPPEGCEPWDRTQNQEVYGPNGEQIGFMRYITPYGVACSHSHDITDYVSLFQGYTRMHLSYPHRSLITMRIKYFVGEPDYLYSWVDELWDPGSYPFGNPADLQPVPARDINLGPLVEDAELKLNTSGHGWGPNNSNNAAEFYEATHNIKVNGFTAFTQHLWAICNPNPDGCQPQNGTWFHNRAGWCPGSFVKVYDYPLGNYIANPFQLEYEFDPNYVDVCHINNPGCVSGVTCDDCSDSYNPNYEVDGHLISYGNEPLTSTLTDIEAEIEQVPVLSIIPNPNQGIFQLSSTESWTQAQILIFNQLGQQVYQDNWNSLMEPEKNIRMDAFAKGIYWVRVNHQGQVFSEKLMIH